MFDSTAIAEVLEGLSTQDLEDRARQAVGNGDFGLVGGSELEFELVELVAVERAAL